MDIRNRSELTAFAGERLRTTPQTKKIAAIYGCIVIGLSLLSAVIDHLLGLSIDQYGGLSNMGTRSTLSALQTMLPLVQSMIVMCIEVGYMAAMLRTARGQYTSPNTLRLGFDRFWVLLRYTLLEGLITAGICIACAYLGIMLFLLTPLSRNVLSLLTPLVSQTTLLDPSVMIPDSVYTSVLNALTPAYVICGILFLLFGAPVLYRLRMSKYVIIDKPALGAMAAMQESRKMMRGNLWNLFKLDLHLWWYYAASFAASVVCYGDQILPMLGITLPFSSDVAFFLFYGIYWVLEFLIILSLRSRLETTYALAYDAIRPKEQPQTGVVLGNIFQM